jgi:hypothetical protein
MTSPTPPADAPKYLVEGLQKQDATTLRALADYAEQLAADLEAEAAAELVADAVNVDDPPEGWDDAGEWDDQLEDAREKADLAAGKGTLTVKTIDGRDYYYLQWREGSTVTSQYVAPVTPAGDSD